MDIKKSYVKELSSEQIKFLGNILEARGWEFKPKEHAHWCTKKDDASVVAYLSGKLTVQGKGTSDFVMFILEPEVLKEFSFGYEDKKEDNQQEAEAFTPHAGIDESGKGDYFGPLVIAAAFVTENAVKPLKAAGVQDSKNIKNDKRITTLASIIRKELQDGFAVVTVGPEAYNRMYTQIGNLNRLLAWGHARALENLLEKVPECSNVIADKFGNEKLIKNALMKNGRNVELIQRTKAESDIAVAAASILARDQFIRKMDQLAKEAGIAKVPRGASKAVETAARTIAVQTGAEGLGRFVKLHFKTTQKILESV
jgi:ribonuclease HIII